MQARSGFVAVNFEKLSNAPEVTWTFWQWGTSENLHIISAQQARAKGGEERQWGGQMMSVVVSSVVQY